ncbi:MAG: glycosyl hydrolase 115 family protein [Bacteroidales bacterium]|nr:glycosyl hydrolase 115 family protein [Bacteroidales bacterium]
MKKTVRFLCLMAILVQTTVSASGQAGFPRVTDVPEKGYFPLMQDGRSAEILTDSADYPVVDIAAGLLADDVERITGVKPGRNMDASTDRLPKGAVLIAGTVGHSRLIDGLVEKGLLDVSGIQGKWESFLITTIRRTGRKGPLLVIAGSDRRGTAYGLVSLSEAAGVSPWYWWADVTPRKKDALLVEPITYLQKEPSVQYRGIFINDERFGGWARWAEQTFDRESGKVGPKTYRKVFELLLRLKANYLWPAMHPGTQAFNDDPGNAQLADEYAIVMGSSHCEQMLRNNEGEWKAVGTYGDFNYLTNRQTMKDYWEERVKTNGGYENTYTLGLRGIHDYPMEGARTTGERVAVMQQAIDDQRDMLLRNIGRPLEEIPQVLCTYEEVLEAYHNGLEVPDDVTLLWSDDKHGYCRNLCNPEEMKRKGGAGIYYHLSYHGDPASWIWLSPLSPAFLSTELTKAYTFGARKIWVFNVGDIKPAEKEISFVMELAWDIDSWQPADAHGYIRHWAAKTFGDGLASEIAGMQAVYYQLQAAGKDAHVYFIDYSGEQVRERIDRWRALAAQAEELETRVPDRLKDAYFELVLYPVRGAAMINEYQLLARRSMARASEGDREGALEDAGRVEELFSQLNGWTRRYNNEILGGKWAEFFNWQPYHWYRSEKIDPPVCTPDLLSQSWSGIKPRFLKVEEALSAGGAAMESEAEGEIPVWIEALSPIRDFSKAPEDNVFCHVRSGTDSFDASATPINNIWHATHVGPMWSRVGTLHLKKGVNTLSITDLKPDASISRIYVGLWPPFEAGPRLRIPAAGYSCRRDGTAGSLTLIPQLGYSDGMMVLPFDTPSYQKEDLDSASCLEFALDLLAGDSRIEIRTLPTLHVYEGRDARYAVQLDSEEPQVFSIHADDFSAEWRRNVLHGYASRSIPLPEASLGRRTLRIYFLDPGIVLQEIAVHPAS